MKNQIFNMNKIYSCLLMSTLVFTACAQEKSSSNVVTIQTQKKQMESITIDDYFDFGWKELNEKVEEYVAKLTPEQRVAQLIMPAMGRLGQPEDKIKRWVNEGKIGGILMLNGTVEQFSEWITTFNETNRDLGYTPFFYSADAEPSLVNRKITGSQTVLKASEITTEEQVRDVATTISKDLLKIGINYNFAPVSDMASNGTVGYRGFGKEEKNIVPFSAAFIKTSTEHNILTSIKHFPGHGLVTGDTHKSLQTIDGEMKELHIFRTLIQQNAPSVMVGHIAVTNNPSYDTKGLPATVSPVIIDGLLRKEMNYKGIVVTDAMNMGGVVKVPNYSVRAIEAGVDILLMPLDTDKSYNEILEKYKADKKFANKVDEATARIIRMKICQKLIQ